MSITLLVGMLLVCMLVFADWKVMTQSDYPGEDQDARMRTQAGRHSQIGFVAGSYEA